MSSALLDSRAGHVCWISEDDGSFLDGAVPFLAEGRQRNERLLLVADEAALPALDGRLAALGLDRTAMLAEGSLVVGSPGRTYDTAEVDVRDQVRRYESMVDAALRDGYAGLRVAADATALATTDVDRRRFLAYEMEIDRFIAGAPMAALCAYDHRALGASARELCAVHPSVHAVGHADPAFRLVHGGDHLRLSGEIDIANHGVLVAALGAATAAADAEVVIDIGRLEFIDLGGLDVLREVARRLNAEGRTLRLTNPSHIVQRTCAHLGFTALVTPTPETESR